MRCTATAAALLLAASSTMAAEPPNFFDRFDEPNPFDQFDQPKPAPRAVPRHRVIPPPVSDDSYELRQLRDELARSNALQAEQMRRAEQWRREDAEQQRHEATRRGLDLFLYDSAPSQRDYSRWRSSEEFGHPYNFRQFE